VSAVQTAVSYHPLGDCRVRVIAVANQKGGCGKTTTSINFSACLASLQKKVLLIDLDPQGHSTCGLGINAEKQPFTVYDLLKPGGDSKPEFSKVICEINPSFWLLPSFVVLSRLEKDLAPLPDCEKYLRYLLTGHFEEISSFDFVIMDCPPNLGILTLNALDAADEIIIPLEPSFFSLHGLAKISETLHQLNQMRKTPIEVHALLTLFDSRTCFGKEIYDEVKTYFKDRLFKTIIHESVILKEAASAGKNIAEYAPDSTAFQDYFNLALEYLEKEIERNLPKDELGWSNVFRHFYGPRQVLGGVLFRVFNKNARSVEVAGDFNQWIPEPLRFSGEEGIWQIVIPVGAGRYRYKYIVDGEWQLDAFQPMQVENAFGTLDSFLEVG
jgi:chromosome partitioning protein